MMRVTTAITMEKEMLQKKCGKVDNNHQNKHHNNNNNNNNNKISNNCFN